MPILIAILPIALPILFEVIKWFCVEGKTSYEITTTGSDGIKRDNEPLPNLPSFDNVGLYGAEQ